jgi:hypothetical protein
MLRVGVIRGGVALRIGGSGGQLLVGLIVALMKYSFERSTACIAHGTTTIPFNHFTTLSSSNEVSSITLQERNLHHN